MEDHKFQIVGPGQAADRELEIKSASRKLPYLSFVILGLLIAGCILADVISKPDPQYMDLMNYSKPPGKGFLFGSDNLGRDLFSCIWHGGRISLAIGVAATVLSAFIAVVYGALSGSSSDLVDTIMMRITEILLSIPSLLLVMFLQAILGAPSIWSIALIIGSTSWCGIAKIVRTEVRQLRQSDYVLASRCMGGNFFHILWKHLGPNFISSIMFMVVMNIRSAIVTESTLSFMGMGLPLDLISWGSLLSLSDKALLTNAWWMIMIPGFFLITLLICLTNIGNWLRKSVNQKERNL